jgi:hypothetical protein
MTVDAAVIQLLEEMGAAAALDRHMGQVAIDAGADETSVRLAIDADAAGGKGAAEVGHVRADVLADLGRQRSQGCGLSDG